jgi:hypothetical protein
MKLELCGQIFEKKKAEISSFVEIRQVEVQFFHMDGRKDRQK